MKARLEEELMQLINEFGAKLTESQYKQYVPKLRDYLVPYILKSENHSDNIENIFKTEFTKIDIINATVFYIENNENVESISAINDYLITVNALFENLIFNKYSNPTLQNLKPFTRFNDDVKIILKEKDICLKEKEKSPVLSPEQYEFIIKYLKDAKSKTLKNIQTKVIIKLFLLYGFDNDKISKMKINDYNKDKKTLIVECKKNRQRKVILELPYSLSKEIDDCIKLREEDPRLNSELLFVTNKNNKITSSYLNGILVKIKKEFDEASSIVEEKNQFTATSIQKYGILQMILEGMNQSIIMELSGQEADIFDDCQIEANRIKELNRNRYVNSNIRNIKTFDEV